MTTNRETKYDDIIKDAVLRHFPELLTDFGPFGWLWICAQIWQESRFDPNAVSPVGAMGLMQLMPATAKELGVTDPFDPEQNINGGVFYLADQYRHMDEIPTYAERIRFALASYNGGRGNINLTLVFGRDAEGLPPSFKRWRLGGRLPGRWQTWSFASSFLSDSRMPRIDYKQIRDYVAKIETRYLHYLHEALDGQGQVLHAGH
ncbi:MAG: transglycosylase SLT domain-containing protein [Pedobacter sp.]